MLHPCTHTHIFLRRLGKGKLGEHLTVCLQTLLTRVETQSFLSLPFSQHFQQTHHVYHDRRPP